MTLEIRPLPEEQLRDYFEVVENAGGGSIDDEAWPYLRATIEPDRVLGAFDGARLVGGGAAYSFDFTVPGGHVPTAGVTWVGVSPTHRRRGLLRQMMAAQLADVRLRGEPLAALWASEGSIYGRFGYGLATLNARLEIERDRAAFRQAIEPRGQMRMLTMAEAAELYPPIYEQISVTTPGFFARTSTWWNSEVLPDLKAFRRGADKKFYLVNERDGEPRGYVMYRVNGDWGDTGTLSVMQVLELLALDADALHETWAYVFGHDLIKTIRARVGPPDHPLLLMASEPRRLNLRVGDGVWLRIVDVAAALAARSYTGSGSLILEVSDGFMPKLGGRWRLTVEDGVGRVESTTHSAELALDITDLGAVYLGGFTFAQLARAGRTAELSSGARVRADALFVSHVQPWCPQIF
jgi:predicted acetyltransferase